MDQERVNRRQVLSGLAAGALLASQAAAADREVPRRPLGKTGEKVSILGVGGFHIGNPDESEGVRIIRTALDNGINFLDNCWDYHDGRSEERMGRALRDGYRDKAFLMTKIDGRTKESAAKQIDESLRRLQTDRIDLLQLHEVIRLEDPDRFFAPGGAVEAFNDAKKAGKVRFFGFTGHKDPLVHMRMIEMAASRGFHFDALQMPLNVMDAHFRSFEKVVLPEAAKQGMGVLGMKPFASGAILKSNTASPTEALRYAMSLPGVTVTIHGMDKFEYLEHGLKIARGFTPMPKTEMAAVLRKTAPSAKNGHFEAYKTTPRFDGTAQNPDWLGEGGNPPAV